jgi:transcriptional regulator with XRE-family HTH domain
VPALSRRHEALGAAIRALRQEQGLSQEHAALECGMDRAYFGGLERGSRNMTVSTFWRVAHGLGIQGSALLTRAEALMGQSGQG